MARTGQHGPSPKQWLSAAVLVLLAFALLPPRWGEWVRGFGDLASILVAPVKEPAATVARWLAPARSDEPGSEAFEQLERDRDEWKTRFYQERARAEELQERLARMARSTLWTDLSVKPVLAPVIGPSSDASGGLLEVRAGRKHGVEVNTVATVDGLQILGIVTRVSESTSWVRLLTSRSTKPISGVVIAEGDQQLQCVLGPTGDGALYGQVEYKPARTGESPVAKVGQEVRLKDESGEWPRNARMLLLGHIESVEPEPQQPLRQLIRVRPTARLERVSEALLRTTIGAAGDEEGGAS